MSTPVTLRKRGRRKTKCFQPVPFFPVEEIPHDFQQVPGFVAENQHCIAQGFEHGEPVFSCDVGDFALEVCGVFAQVRIVRPVCLPREVHGVDERQYALKAF